MYICKIFAYADDIDIEAWAKQAAIEAFNAHSSSAKICLRINLLVKSTDYFTFTVIGLLFGIQTGCTKYFLRKWGSSDRKNHYTRKSGLP